MARMMWSVRAGTALLILVMLIVPSSIQAPAVAEGGGPAAPLSDSFSTVPLVGKGMETFDGLPNGLKDPRTIDLGMGTLTLHDPSLGEETVVLGGQLVSSVREAISNATIATFTPWGPGDSWAMSSEIYPARDLSINQVFGVPSPLNVMNITLESGGAAVASVVLQVGELGEEGIKVRPGPGGEWTSVVDDVLPGYSRRHAPDGPPI